MCILHLNTECAVPENIHTPPQQKGLKFPGGWELGRFYKTEKIKEMCMEFPEEWKRRGVLEKHHRSLRSSDSNFQVTLKTTTNSYLRK